MKITVSVLGGMAAFLGIAAASSALISVAIPSPFPMVLAACFACLSACLSISYMRNRKLITHLECDAALGKMPNAPRFPQKWSEDAFVLLAGLRHSIIWELAPSIVAEITRLVEEGLKLDDPAPPETTEQERG